MHHMQDHMGPTQGFRNKAPRLRCLDILQKRQVATGTRNIRLAELVASDLLRF